MLVTLSERKLCDLIRQLENIQDSSEELLVRFDYYCGRLFVHIAEYGVTMKNLVQNSGAVAAFKFELNPHRRETITAGLRLLNPVAVSLEVEDIGALVANPVVAAGLRDAWGEIGPQLQRIAVSDIMTKLEKFASTVAFRPKPIANEGELIEHELGYQTWLLQNNLEDPAAKSTHLREFREAEAARFEAAQKAANEKSWESRNRSTDNSFWIEEVK